VSFFAILILNITFSWSNDNKIANLSYIENKGQWNEKVKFKVDMSGATAFLEKDGITYLLSDKIEHNHQQHEKKALLIEEEHEIEQVIRYHAYNFRWLNTNSTVLLQPSVKEKAYNNYFIGNDKSKWASNVSIYKNVTYKNLYNQIDAKVYSTGNSMKIDYVVKKGAKVSDIQLRYNGTDNIRISNNGQLRITTSLGELVEIQPYVYQNIGGIVTIISCKYTLTDNVVSFKLLEDYDKNYDLIIDPTLIFSTYSGSPVDNWGSSSTYDSEGNMFLGGISLGTDYPTTMGAFQTTFGGPLDSFSNNTDIVITKFNNIGTNRIFSTYLGGNNNELLSSLYCTPQNELVVLLVTGSPNFPTTVNAYDTSFNYGFPVYTSMNIYFDTGVDVALTKLSSNGSALVGSTFFGGSGNDGFGFAYNYGDETRSDIALTSDGDIIICSSTNSYDLPNTSGRFQPNFGGDFRDGFIARFNSNLSSNKWATYFGSTGRENANGIALDKNENIFICGLTNSVDLPGSNVGLNQTLMGFFDGYVTKVNNNATQVLATTYLGTANYDQAFLIDTDNEDNIVVFGQTTGHYPITNGVYSNANAPQFIHKLNNNLNTTIFSTVFGHTEDSSYKQINISPTALLVDVCGSVYAVGWGGRNNYSGSTFSMPITNDAFQDSTDGSDFYFITFNRDASNIIYATYFGEYGGSGDHVDGGTSRFDKNGVVYQAVCASCWGTNSFPTTDSAYSKNNNSDNCNMAGIKFKFDFLPLQIISIIPTKSCVLDSAIFSYTSTQPATSFFWDFGDGQTSDIEFPKHKYSNAGTYNVKLVLRNPDNCNVVDSAVISIFIGDSISVSKDTVICEGNELIFGEQLITQSGIYRDTFKTIAGCDSFVKLNVIVRPTATNIIDTTFCNDGMFVFNGQIITQTGTYRDTLKTTFGCDSFIILNAIIRQASITIIDTSICTGTSIVFNEQEITQAGTYRDTLKTTTGCDSIIVLNVRIISISNTIIDSTFCEGDTVIIASKKYYSTGRFFDTLVSVRNCDSILIINIQIIKTKDTTLNVQICKSDSVVVGNMVFKQTGNYQINLISKETKCDSIVYLHLNVVDTLFTNIDTTICLGQRIIVNGTNYTETGTYRVSMKSSKGCDSIVNLKLLVVEPKYITIDSTVCEGDSVQIGSQIFKTQGEYVVRLLGVQKCDSTVTLNLKVNPIKYTTIDSTICEGSSVVINNHTYTISGQTFDTLVSSLNCDSIITLNLTVLKNSSTTINPEICEGESFVVGDSIYTKTGRYIIIYDAANSCDSTLNINLTVHPNKINNLSREICNGDSIVVGTIIYKEQGTYTQILKSSKGCDSTVNLDLIVHQHKTTSIDTSICFGDSILVGNNYYKTNGQFIENLQTSKMCDSIVTLNLNVYPEIIINATTDKAIIEKGEVAQLNVEANQELGYLWSPSNTLDNSIIKNPIASPTTPTWFVVEATNTSTNCKVSDSVFVDILILPCNEEYIYIPNAFTPNGDNVNDVFIVRSKNLTSGTMLIYDRWGNKVFESDDINVGWNGMYKGEMQQQEAYGFYFTGICDGGATITIKGNVTLLK
jgi:gliding motility-associated-like protein